MSKKQATKTVSIEETTQAMNELVSGVYPPSFLSALRNSALSCQLMLISNAGYAIVLRKYRDKPLPPRAQLENELRTEAIRQDGTGKLAWGLMQSHLNTLYAIDTAWFGGKIHLDYGLTFESQRLWRERLVGLLKGMGWKLISWALFIYDPVNCQLMTIDSIHCRRLGLDQRTLSGSNERQQEEYERIEKQVMAECLSMHALLKPQVTAAMLWFNFRGKGITSHQGISCRY